MPQTPKVFIGSSTEGLSVARAVKARLEETTEPAVWDEIPRLGYTVIEFLIQALERYEFAVFVFSADDKIKLRDNRYLVTRDNVILELGLFLAKLGRGRCFIVQPRGVADFHLPTDLLGLITGTYNSDQAQDNAYAAVGTACEEIKRHIKSWPADGRSAELPNRARVDTPPPTPTAAPQLDTPGGAPSGPARVAAVDAATVDQVAAVCYRIGERGVEFYLVRTDSGRIIFPKGYPETPDLAEAAGLEAETEAGVVGTVTREAFTRFSHWNARHNGPLTIAAFLIRVERTVAPAEANRQPQWYSPDEALAALARNRTTEHFLEFAHVVREAMRILQRVNPSERTC